MAYCRFVLLNNNLLHSGYRFRMAVQAVEIVVFASSLLSGHANGFVGKNSTDDSWCEWWCL